LVVIWMGSTPAAQSAGVFLSLDELNRDAAWFPAKLDLMHFELLCPVCGKRFYMNDYI
jgi:hypothetical protein